MKVVRERAELRIVDLQHKYISDGDNTKGKVLTAPRNLTVVSWNQITSAPDLETTKENIQMMIDALMELYINDELIMKGTQ